MTVALLTTLALAIPALGVYLHNSYFTVAQLHLVLLGTVLTSFLAGLFHWLPTLTNREYSRSLGFLAAAGMLLGGAVTFVPQFILGTLGSPKGLHSYRTFSDTSCSIIDWRNSLGCLTIAGNGDSGLGLFIQEKTEFCSTEAGRRRR